MNLNCAKITKLEVLASCFERHNIDTNCIHLPETCETAGLSNIFRSTSDGLSLIVLSEEDY